MKHIAGIIPVSGIKSDINAPVGPSLLPISLNYLAIERSVIECAYAGCDTIWIVCDDSTKPLVRYTLGDYIYDPIYASRTRALFPKEHRRLIKIYYIPVSSRFHKQKSVWLSILSGCLTSKKISAGMSKWLKPTKYYISFPTGVYDPECVKAYRQVIRSSSDACLYHEEKSIITNDFLGASFKPSTLDAIIKKYSHDRFSGLPIKMFEGVSDFDKLSASRYVDITTWDAYLQALDLSLSKPSLIPVKELNGLANDDAVAEDNKEKTI